MVIGIEESFLFCTLFYMVFVSVLSFTLAILMQSAALDAHIPAFRDEIDVIMNEHLGPCWSTVPD